MERKRRTVAARASQEGSRSPNVESEQVLWYLPGAKLPWKERLPPDGRFLFRFSG